MSLSPVWGSLFIFLVCPLLGGLPLIDWITYAFTRQNLARLGTGNISVSAAFYHGGKLVGILAVVSEAAKGIIAVLVTRAFFPGEPTWELIALIALVMGRYWMGKGAGTTNALWGVIAHDWQAALLMVLIGGGSFTIFRDRNSGRFICLFLLVLILALRHPHEGEYIVAAIALATILAWIHENIPDDLDLPETGVSPESQQVFSFFRGDRGIASLKDKLEVPKVGQKAANLSRLKRLGYSVPNGWLLSPGDDWQSLLEFLNPTADHPLIVRSSAIGEDSDTASAAGQYQTIANVTSREALQVAILDCLASYNHPSAVQYRQDRRQAEASMAVLIQQQIRGVFSGVAFSRDPVNPQQEAIVIEALPGDASRVVSGKVTPERYFVSREGSVGGVGRGEGGESGDVPPGLIEAVAGLTREIESLAHGIPQDVEWTYDGQQLWILQARSISTLQPIWTRKIAAEVIPGVIRPLTWAINRPLTCGVWGEIFSLVLGKSSQDLDFDETATLHYQRAYFNATLLGEIFRRMGLPSESLEFLTRGAKFSQPPLLATLGNIPGLLRLLRREWRLVSDFERDRQNYFTPTLNQLARQAPSDLSAAALLERIEIILAILKRATYYSILAPLSLALRQAIAKVPPEALDNSHTPEVESVRSLVELANQARQLLAFPVDNLDEVPHSLFADLSKTSAGKVILVQFQQWLERYGYLGEVATDIAVPRWQEDPRSQQDLFLQFIINPPTISPSDRVDKFPSWKRQVVQKRLNLKGKTTEVYSQLLAHLRWSFLALENIWRKSGLLKAEGDIFFLEFAEIQQLVLNQDHDSLSQRLQQRRKQFQQAQQLTNIPYVVYGNASPLAPIETLPGKGKHRLQGIGASPGQVEGRVKILKTLQSVSAIDRQTILVVPYTDSGWASLLARAGGLIAEVGGCLSHGAIIAREYGIPAVMDVHHATQILSDGQRVRINGQSGIIEIILNSEF